MNNQVPNIAVVSSAIVLLANMFLGTSLVEEQTQQVVSAVVVLVLAGASVWSWIKTKRLSEENIALNKRVADLITPPLLEVKRRNQK